MKYETDRISSAGKDLGPAAALHQPVAFQLLSEQVDLFEGERFAESADDLPFVRSIRAAAKNAGRNVDRFVELAIRQP